MNAFFENLLRDHPEQCQEMRQWFTNQLIAPGGLVPSVPERENVIAWTPPPPLPSIDLPQEEVAHSEAEMLRLDRVSGDRIFRSDLDQTFIFIGGNPLDPDQYFRFMILGFVALEGYGCIYQAFQLPAELLSPESHNTSATSKPIRPNQDECKFHSGTMFLRCAVNPCAKTCEGCVEFEPKYKGS